MHAFKVFREIHSHRDQPTRPNCKCWNLKSHGIESTWHILASGTYISQTHPGHGTGIRLSFFQRRPPSIHSFHPSSCRHGKRKENNKYLGDVRHGWTGLWLKKYCDGALQVAWMDTVQLSIRAALFVGSFLTRINLSVVPLTRLRIYFFLTMVPGPLTHGGRFSRCFLSLLPLVEFLRFHPGHAITATKRKKNPAILHRLVFPGSWRNIPYSFSARLGDKAGRKITAKWNEQQDGVVVISCSIITAVTAITFINHQLKWTGMYYCHTDIYQLVPETDLAKWGRKSEEVRRSSGCVSSFF